MTLFGAIYFAFIIIMFSIGAYCFVRAWRWDKMIEPIMCPLCHKPVSEYADNGSWVIECLNSNCLLIVGPLEEKNRLRKMMGVDE